MTSFIIPKGLEFGYFVPGKQKLRSKSRYYASLGRRKSTIGGGPRGLFPKANEKILVASEPQKSFPRQAKRSRSFAIGP